MNHDSICIHYCSEDNIVSVQGCYPQCENCKHKEPAHEQEFELIQCSFVCVYMTALFGLLSFCLPFVALTISKEVFTFSGLH